jgi:hypothetical protein
MTTKPADDLPSAKDLMRKIALAEAEKLLKTCVAGPPPRPRRPP